MKIRRDYNENVLRLYISQQRERTLYTGVSINLIRRIIEHKRKTIKGFTEKYNVNKSVW